MRPNKFFNMTMEAIDHRVKTGSNKLFTPYLIKEIKRQHKKRCKEHFESYGEHENCTGAETYGYKSKESIECSLHYIRDRFNAAYRLRWLIDGLENGSI